MDVVKTHIAKIGGVVEVSSADIGIGTRIAITLPITLAIVSLRSSSKCTVASTACHSPTSKRRFLGLISFWAINRDQACGSSNGGLAICSGKNRGTFDFHNIFKTVE